MEIAVSRGGSLAAASDEVILFKSAKIFDALNSNSSGPDIPKPFATLSGGCFGFSLSFASYTANGRDSLPPSQSLFHQGTHCNINYTVKVDVIRKGLRRHERCAFLSASVCAEVAWGSLLHVNQLPGLRYRSCICPAQPRPVKSSCA